MNYRDFDEYNTCEYFYDIDRDDDGYIVIGIKELETGKEKVLRHADASSLYRKIRTKEKLAERLTFHDKEVKRKVIMHTIDDLIRPYFVEEDTKSVNQTSSER